jgi:hypothetical protein
MMKLAVIGALVGVALGLRSKILVFVPAVVLATIFPILVGVGRGDSFWSIVLTTASGSDRLSAGLLGGIRDPSCD